MLFDRAADPNTETIPVVYGHQMLMQANTVVTLRRSPANMVTY